VFVKAGSRYETFDTNGSAHFVSHSAYQVLLPPASCTYAHLHAPPESTHALSLSLSLISLFSLLSLSLSLSFTHRSQYRTIATMINV